MNPKIKKFSRAMDVVLSIAGIIFAIYMIYTNYPVITGWTWVAIIAAIISIPMAIWDWSLMFENKIKQVFVRKR